jgi:putative ABC transport system substrate-binding protein
MLNPTEPAFNTELEDVQDAARATGQKIRVLRASTEGEIDAAFAMAKEIDASAMLVGSSFIFNVRLEQVIRLAARARLPTIYGQREYTTGGGLISYGTDLADAYYQAGVYISRILKGARPADLPVIQSTKFELVINLKTAKDLGLNFPLSMHQLADEAIE